MAKVLVIEDEAPLLAIILEILSFEGFEVIGAENGRIGVQMAREHLPDLIVADIMMPELDGYGVLLELRRDPSTATIPFVFLTAKADRIDMRKGMEIGADDYLTKPFESSDLVAAINSRLEKKAAIAKEYEQKLDELRGNIIYMLPHELRTPLTYMMGYLLLLQEPDQEFTHDQIISMAEQMTDACWRLTRLIENFLVYAQTEIMKSNPEMLGALRRFECAHPQMLIEDLARNKARHVDRESDLMLELGEVSAVRVEEDNLKKIVEELTDNAFKFSEPGTPVHITGTLDGDQYILTVSDRGRGMPPAQVASIGAYMQFERRLHEQQGSGLGLIIASRLAELQGGELTIRSVLGKGTTVYVAMPMQEG